MEKIKENIPVWGTVVTFGVLLALLVTGNFDWGTFLASLPGLIVVYNTLLAAINPGMIVKKYNKVINPYQNLEYRVVSKIKSLF